MSRMVYTRIHADAEGRPVIAGTSIKVRMIALDQLAHSWGANEIHKAHPQLSLDQNCSALAATTITRRKSIAIFRSDTTGFSE